MSQIIRATFVSPSFQGISWNVSGSGIATMSDSSIALKPVIDEPSNPIPSSSAAPISLGVTANDFRCPSMSLNQRSTNSTPSSSIRFTTSRRPSSRDAARFLLSTCGAGFIGSHFAERLLRAGNEAVVLDKLTYAGNEANVPVGAEFQRGDVALRENVEAIGAVDAIVNFAAESHVDRSILGPT